jgi:hypothetical protein
MSTAQIIYEQYKVLPVRVKNELIALINKDNDEYVQVCLPSLVEGLKELKQVLDGKKQGRDAREFLNELRGELANE